ncbi:MAG: hypothetical protein PF487_12030 [Bacteroidales bacterium]|nr:hypothetical protein [Bacteroidales bacterium]
MIKNMVPLRATINILSVSFAPEYLIIPAYERKIKKEIARTNNTNGIIKLKLFIYSSGKTKLKRNKYAKEIDTVQIDKSIRKIIHLGVYDFGKYIFIVF